NLYAIVEERQFSNTFSQDFKMEFDIGECLSGSKKVNLRTATFCRAGNYQRRNRNTALELHLIRFAITIDLQTQPVGKRVHYRNTYTVQTAGYFVRVLVELAACMKLRHDDFSSGTFDIVFIILLD